MKHRLFVLFAIAAVCAAIMDQAANAQYPEQSERAEPDREAESDRLNPAEDPAQGKTHTVTVNADGTFSPMRIWIRDGDTVEWVFHDRTDTIIPINGPHGLPYKPYDPTDPNEFTGPMPLAPSGIFTLGPDRPGWVVKTSKSIGKTSPPGEAYAAARRFQNEATKVDRQYLAQTGEAYATMDWTWRNPNITGVFIRLRWNTVHRGPDDFDWTVMDREIEKAVRNGKLYSLSFKAGAKGTPDWIFKEGVTKLQFQDGGSKLQRGRSGRTMFLGSPSDPDYRKHYFALLTAAADHIRERNAWYRALAYIKPSGANLFTHENRLPKRCHREGVGICNPEVWALKGGYTPKALYEFYSQQTALLAKAFPDKSMSYMLIQAGFPKVNNDGKYEGQPGTRPSELPGDTEQTEHVLEQGQKEHGTRFAVQHNALRPGKPPNRWVLHASSKDQVTGFQTTNRRGVYNPEELESALRNAWDNSRAVFIEIYEERFWEAEVGGPILDPDASEPRTIGQWADKFHDRRRNDWPEIPDPFPLTYSHTFKRTIDPKSGNQFLYYMHGSKYGTEPIVNYGVIGILPDD